MYLVMHLKDRTLIKTNSQINIVGDEFHFLDLEYRPQEIKISDIESIYNSIV